MLDILQKKMNDDIIKKLDDDFIKSIEEEVAKFDSCAAIWIDKDSNRLEIILDTSVSSYSDWIKGEGSDIGLLRNTETNKVIGVTLPLYKTNFSICHTDGIEIKINEGFKKS
jgi:hypothetical protein